MYSNMIQELLSGKDSEGVFQQVTEMAQNKDISLLNVLFELLKTTENDRLRNEIAIALSSLDQQDYILHIEYIIPYIGDPALEVSAQALMLLEQIKDRLSDQQIQSCLESLECQIKHNENKLLVVASEILKG